jgi:hypothetical protein
MENHAKVENSGFASSPPSRILTNLLKAKYTTKTRKILTESIKNQPVLVDT